MQTIETYSVITLRAATPSDVDALYALLLGYFDSFALPYPRPRLKDGMAWLARLCTANTVIVAESGGKIIGSTAMEVCEFGWDTSKPYLFGHWLYVDPEYRKSRAGSQLIQAAKAVAYHNAMILMMGNIWNVVPAPAFDRIMRAAGFKATGNNYVYVPLGLHPIEEN